jgi:hypothetical protein
MERRLHSVRYVPLPLAAQSIIPLNALQWKVTSLKEPGKFYITNHGTNSGGDLNVGLEFVEIVF